MSNSTTATASEKIMERVAALLAVAEHPNTGEHEAETALAMANSLITKHAIDEALLRQSQSISERRAITKMTVVLGGGTFRPYLRTIFEAAAEALRVSVAFKATREHGIYEPVAHLYGAQEDVVWLDMLFNMIKLQFLTKLDPKWDTTKGYDENVYNFKVAGFKWAEIDRIAQRSGGFPRRESTKFVAEVSQDSEWDYWERRTQWRTGLVLDYDKGQVREYNGFFHALKAAYVRHAKAIGDDTRVKTQSHEAYRLSFAESYRSTMTERFWKMADEAKAQMDTIPGAALAIRDTKEDADRAMWADFPEMSPEEIKRRQDAFKAQYEAERAAYQAKLDAMTPAERQRFLEEKERKEAKDARAQRAWEKKNTRYFTYDNAARAQGAKAANSVDLTRKAGSAGQGGTKGQIG